MLVIPQRHRPHLHQDVLTFFAPTPRTKHRRFLRVEPLEERVVLSTYWVSPSGNDSNSGSASSPFATLQHSMMSLKPGDTLNVESGTYTGFIAGWDSTPASSGDRVRHDQWHCGQPDHDPGRPQCLAGIGHHRLSRQQDGCWYRSGARMQLYHHLGDHRGEWRTAALPRRGIKICGNNNMRHREYRKRRGRLRYLR